MTIRTLAADWNQLLAPEFTKPYYTSLVTFVNSAYQSKLVYPPANLVFNAFNLCSFDALKVVIIGQDPYHQPSQAHGLCFSVNAGVKIPPSLVNIFKEIKADIPEFEIPHSGNLEKWASQGILLLNSVLTVEAGLAGSHKNAGWQNFTDATIQLISSKKEHVVFLLWGAYAIAKTQLIDQNKHLVLTAAHPSPLARGAFFGNKHFSRTNKYLMQHGLEPINWKLT